MSISSRNKINELEVRLQRLYKESNLVEALSCIDLVLRIDPCNPQAELHRGLILRDQGRFKEAVKALQSAVYQNGNLLEAMLVLAVLHWKMGDHKLAISAVKKAVLIAPQDSKIRMSLAAMYGSMGYEEKSKKEALISINIQAYVKHASLEGKVKLKVLVISSPLSSDIRYSQNQKGVVYMEGMNNLANVLDVKSVEVTRFYVDGDEPKRKFLSNVKNFDVVYNSLADSDRTAQALEKASWLLSGSKIPVINRPSNVVDCSREGVVKKLQGRNGLVVPKVASFSVGGKGLSEEVNDRVSNLGFCFPFLIRLKGYQGGKFMQLVDGLNIDELVVLEKELAVRDTEVLAIQYLDVGYVDSRLPSVTLYKKYRAFLVGEKLYPIHCFTSNKPIVHKENAKPLMDQHPWMVDEEKEYINAPAQHLGGEHWSRLEEAMKSFGLEYNGVDFALGLDESGKEAVVVFEINPAMRNRTHELPYGDHVQQAWEKATRALHTIFCQKAGVNEWDFELPRSEVNGLTIPAGIVSKEKAGNIDKLEVNQRWLKNKLLAENEFPGSQFFNVQHYMGEELLDAEAARLGINVLRRDGRCLEMEKDGNEVVFHINAPRVSLPAHSISKDKWAVKKLLERCGVKVPASSRFEDFESAYRYFAEQALSQVVKPVDGSASRGVTVDVNTPTEFLDAWSKAKAVSDKVIVEDMLAGEELRVTFYQGEYIGTLLRKKPFVVGDGKKTVSELVEIKNKRRALNPMTAKFPITKESCTYFNDLDVNAVPAKDAWVTLGNSRTYIQGAEYIDISESVPHSFIEVCRRATQSFPSCLVGVDVFVDDLTTFENVYITEVNASTPGIQGYHFPRFGKAQNVARKMILHAMEHLSQSGFVAGEKSIAALCDAVYLEVSNFAQHFLQMTACYHNIYCQRVNDDALVLGDPACFSWSNGVSMLTPLESILMCGSEAWLNERLKKFNVLRGGVATGYFVRVLMANNCLIAAHAQQDGLWRDISDQVHIGAVDLAYNVMKALYCPGHALLTFNVIDHSYDPKTLGWGLVNINLSPDLSIFYKDIDKPRDVIPALLSQWLPNYEKGVVDPQMCTLTITGKWDDGGDVFCQWLDQHLHLHSLKGEYQLAEETEIVIALQGQPNAIKSFIDNTRFGDLEEQVVNIDSNFITQEEKFEVQDPDKLTLHLSITGKVQNVGYRRWFADQMEVLGILGWVRNLTDGSVEAVIHGPQNTLQMLLDEVPKGTAGAEVTGLKADLWDGELPKCVEVLSSK